MLQYISHEFGYIMHVPLWQTYRFKLKNGRSLSHKKVNIISEVISNVG